MRSTLRVRNVRESVVYHLLFDGDIGKLTGQQLKTHIQAICHIPPEQQLLTYNGQPVHATSTGYNLDLRNGGMLLLDYVARQPSPAEEASIHVSQSRSRVPSESQPRSPSRRHIVQSQPQPASSSVMRGPSRVATGSMPRAAAREEISRLETEIENIRRQEEEILRRQDELRRGRNVVAYGLHRDSAYPSYAVSGLHDEVDYDVEVVEESEKVTWHPTSSVDVDEARTLQQDYVWKMEQVRFETERMNRWREMKRQQQELEYQAELLDRERVELERKTHMARNKFENIQRQMADEMTIEARFIQPSSYQ
jgi:hypothetical protein